ncbi:hypothetical protein [Streptomyces sp. 2A115]|uniref:hypothetical protein n=1 Tax=Streptomyces sp. 2A115 TaxID=3457439 RepID=UPI003FD1D411
MSTVTNEPEALAVDGPPIDAELIADSTAAALTMELGTSTREEIDTSTQAMIKHLNRLLAEELGADEDPDVRGLFRQAYRLLELTSRPTRQTAVFNAFLYMRDAANLARRLLRIYTEPSRHAT